MNNGQAIGAAIERGIIGQTGLVTSLSLAVIGGLLALMIQVKIHNSGKHSTKEITFDGFQWFVSSLILAGLAIISGFFIYGMMIQMAPLIFTHEFDRVKFSDQTIDYILPDSKELHRVPIGALRWLSITQAGFFLVSVGCAAVVMIKNRPMKAQRST